jgi:hypothetical protein
MTKQLKDVVRRGMMQKIADTLRAGEQLRVLLLELEEAVSARGTTYWCGWAGRAKLVGFCTSEPNERGFPTTRICADRGARAAGWPAKAAYKAARARSGPGTGGDIEPSSAGASPALLGGAHDDPAPSA